MSCYVAPNVREQAVRGRHRPLLLAHGLHGRRARALWRPTQLSAGAAVEPAAPAAANPASVAPASFPSAALAPTLAPAAESSPAVSAAPASALASAAFAPAALAPSRAAPTRGRSVPRRRRRWPPRSRHIGRHVPGTAHATRGAVLLSGRHFVRLRVQEQKRPYIRRGRLRRIRFGQWTKTAHFRKLLRYECGLGPGRSGVCAADRGRWAVDAAVRLRRGAEPLLRHRLQL